MTDDVPSWAAAESRRYIIGPSVDLSLPLRFSIEVDALYHRVGYQAHVFFPIGDSGIFSEHQRANSWEFPLLLKRDLRAKTFVEAGLTPRRITGTTADISYQFSAYSTLPLIYTSAKVDSICLGVAAGGGVRFSVGRLRISPEARYTFWTSPPNLGPALSGSQSQVDILVGIGWKLGR